jgi:aspartate aminotransferase
MDVTPFFGSPEKADAGLSSLSRSLVGSEILKIAGEIRALTAKGAAVCNLTVGDFDPRCFPIPAELLEATRAALAAGQTNYPPSDGVVSLREAIARAYERDLGLRYPLESVIVSGGARPLVYASYKTILDPGDVVVYPVPSWNNNHYSYLAGARAVEIPVSAETNFFPTVEEIRPYLPAARLLVINSPNNPTGTVIAREELRRITEAVVEENRRREARQTRPLYLLYDQVYWALTFGSAVHVTPVELVPEVAPWTLLLDAISKSFCSTGLRVGWGVVPPAVRKRMADLLGHVGAWAPKAEQVAVAKLLDRPDVIRAYQSGVRANLKARLDALYGGFMEMKAEGLPVDALMPQGAIYLSGRFDLFGRTFRGKRMKTDEDIRRLLLDEAGLGVVPFQAFGLKGETGWFRLSAGAVSMEDISTVFPRLRAVLGAAVTVAG